MKLTFDMQEQLCNVQMSGDFVAGDNARFTELFALIEEKDIKKLVVDVANLSFMDSSALGMLLLLRDIAQLKGVSLTLSYPQGQVKQMFDATRLDSLFTIQHG